MHFSHLKHLEQHPGFRGMLCIEPPRVYLSLWINHKIMLQKRNKHEHMNNGGVCFCDKFH